MMGFLFGVSVGYAVHYAWGPFLDLKVREGLDRIKAMFQN